MYFAAVEARGDGAVLRAAGALEPGAAAPRAARGAAARISLYAGEALASALPGVALEEAEEAFRWEVAKSGAVFPGAERAVVRRAVGQDPGPPFLGLAGDPGAAATRAADARRAGLVPDAVVVEALAFERLLVAAGLLPSAGTLLHVDVREGTSVLSAFGAGGLALRRTVRTSPISPENLAIDIQRSASYAERKLALPPCEAVYFTGEGVDPALVEAVGAGLPGLTVEALDPLTVVDLDPKLDATAAGAIAYALALPIGLALLPDSGPPDFLPPVERDARLARRASDRLRVSALVLAPALLALGLYVRHGSGRTLAALADAEARVARLELIEKRSAELRASHERAQAWRAGLRRLGDRERAVSDVLVTMVASLPGEAYLTNIDLKGRGDDLELRIRGELVAPDQSTALSARDPLRKAANELAPGAQVVFDAARMVAGRVRIGFSIDGVAAPSAPKKPEEPAKDAKSAAGPEGGGPGQGAALAGGAGARAAAEAPR
jgi:hypothetical protein